MPRYDHAIIVTLEADDYDKSLMELDWLTAGIGDSNQIACSAAAYEVDNEGQRVVYLHPDNETSVN